MTDVNPNSRAQFVDKEGKLTKYGADTIRRIFNAIGLSGDSSAIDDIESDSSSGVGIDKSARSRIEELENQLVQPVARIKDLKTRIEELEDVVTVYPHRIKALERRISELEDSDGPQYKLKSILKRIQEIEDLL